MFPSDPKGIEYSRLHNMLATGMNNTLSAQEDFEQNDGTMDDIFEYLQRQQVAGRFQEAVAEMEKSSSVSMENMSISAAILNPTSEGGVAVPYPLHCRSLHSSEDSEKNPEYGSQSPSPYSREATSKTDDQNPMHHLSSDYADGRGTGYSPASPPPAVYCSNGEPRSTRLRRARPLVEEDSEEKEDGGVSIDFSSHHQDLELELMTKDAENSDGCSETLSCPHTTLSDYESGEDDESIVFQGRRKRENAKSLVDTSKIPSRSEALADTYKELCVIEDSPFVDPSKADKPSPDSYHAFLSLRGGGDEDCAIGPNDDDDSEHSDSSETASNPENVHSEDEDADDDTAVEGNNEEVDDDFTPSTHTKKSNRHNVTPAHLFYPKHPRSQDVQLWHVKREYEVTEEDDHEAIDHSNSHASRTNSSKPSQRNAEPASVSSQKPKKATPKKDRNLKESNATKGAGAQPSRKKLRADAARAAELERENDASQWLREFHVPTPKEQRGRKKAHKRNHADLSSRFNKPEDGEDDDFDSSVSLRGGGDDHFALGPADDDVSEHSSDEEGEVEIILRPEYRRPYVEDGEEESEVRGGSLRSGSRYVLLDAGKEDDTEVIRAYIARFAAVEEEEREVEDKPSSPAKGSAQQPPEPKLSQQFTNTQASQRHKFDPKTRPSAAKPPLGQIPASQFLNGFDTPQSKLRPAASSEPNPRAPESDQLHNPTPQPKHRNLDSDEFRKPAGQPLKRPPPLIYSTDPKPATRQASNTHTRAPEDHHEVPDVPGTWHEDSDDEQLDRI